MKPSNFLFLVVLTLVTVFLFLTLIPELCAVATFFAVICIAGWGDTLDSLQLNRVRKKNKITKT